MLLVKSTKYLSWVVSYGQEHWGDMWN